MDWLYDGYFVNVNSLGLGQSFVMTVLIFIILCIYLIYFDWSRLVYYALLMEIGMGLYMLLFILIVNADSANQVFWLTRALYTVFLLHAIAGAFTACYINPHQSGVIKYVTVSMGILLSVLIYASDWLLITREVKVSSFGMAVKGPLIVIFFMYMAVLAVMLIVSLMKLIRSDKAIFRKVWPIYVGLIFLVTYTNIVGIYLFVNPYGRQTIYINGMVFNGLLIFYLSMEIKRNLNERERVLKQFSTDALTKVHTRSYVFEQIEKNKLKKGCMNCYIAIMDLDGFKLINDLHGHHVGDEVLEQIGLVLNEVENDKTIVARIGGDEFLIYFMDTDEELMYQKVESIKKKYRLIAGKYDTDYKKMDISVGYCQVKAESTIEEIVAFADERMYREKSSKLA